MLFKKFSQSIHAAGANPFKLPDNKSISAYTDGSQLAAVGMENNSGASFDALTGAP